MPVNEALAHALSDLTLDPLDLADADLGQAYSLSVGHGTIEAGASVTTTSCFTACVCSCCC